MLYREFETQEELDAQYNVGESVADSTEYAEFYAEQSREVRADLDCHLDVSFGPTVAERLLPVLGQVGARLRVVGPAGLGHRRPPHAHWLDCESACKIDPPGWVMSE